MSDTDFLGLLDWYDSGDPLIDAAAGVWVCLFSVALHWAVAHVFVGHVFSARHRSTASVIKRGEHQTSENIAPL